MFSPSGKNKDAASRRLLLMSFEGMRKSIRTMEAPTEKTDAPAHLSDEFPAGYSLTGCSPALPASASPTKIDYASALAQVRRCLAKKYQRKANRKPQAAVPHKRDQILLAEGTSTRKVARRSLAWRIKLS
jgi:hypothetical protein